MNRHVFHFILLITCVGSLVGRGQVVPLPQAHAHNDYEHEHPLMDALSRGFCSVEADIYLVDGRLLVAHDLVKTRPERTLQALYLDPLRERVRTYHGRVHPNQEAFTLLIDLKSEAEATYATLRTVLRDYEEMLTEFQSDRTRPRAVTIILSGNRPTQTVADEPKRWVGIDGRLPDLKSNPSPQLMPLVSDNWGNHFAWQGQGELSERDRVKLDEAVRLAHAQGRRIRFWAVPDRREGWAIMREAGVDLINTDHLDGLRVFLLGETP